MNFDFNNPEFLWLLLVLPILAFLRGKSGKTGSILFSSVAIAKVVSGKNKARVGKALFFLRLLALALLIIAFARPRLGKNYSEREESGIDIMLAVDVSGSMSALDLSENRSKPMTRLDAVKRVVEDFIKNRPSDRIGMVAFATNSFLVSPLTLDHDWLTKNVDRLEIGVVDSTSTAIGSAIGMSVNKLRAVPNAKSKVIILLTDGENNSGKISPIAAAQAAASFDTKIYTIAAGRKGIVQVALMNEKGVVRDRAGNLIPSQQVNSSVDEETLKKMADITGGQFYSATNFRQLQKIYDEIDKLETTKVKLRNFMEYEELFSYFVLAGLILILLEYLLAQTRYRTLP